MTRKTEYRTVVIGFGLLVLFIVVFVAYQRRHPESWEEPASVPDHPFQPNPSPIPKTDEKADAIAAIYSLFWAANVASAKLEASVSQFGDTLDVYVQKGKFESIPFADRKGLIEQAGKLWCARANGAFPSLSIFDIQTGERLGEYSCRLSSVSLP